MGFCTSHALMHASHSKFGTQENGGRLRDEFYSWEF